MWLVSITQCVDTVRLQRVVGNHTVDGDWGDAENMRKRAGKYRCRINAVVFEKKIKLEITIELEEKSEPPVDRK